MKKITFLILLFLFSFPSFSQVLQEGFENTAGPDLGTDQWALGSGIWAVYDNGVGINQSWTISNSVQTPPLVFAGTNAAFMNRENVGPGNTALDYLVTPQVLIPANGQLRFWSRSTQNGPQGTVYKVMVSTTSQTDAASFTLVQAYTEEELSTVFNIYEEKVIDLSAYANTNVYVAFVMELFQETSSLISDRWLLDEVRIVEKCLEPTNLGADLITQTSAQLNWDNPGGAAQFEVEIMPFAVDPTGAGIIVNTNSFNATQTTTPAPGTLFTPTTQYQYYVRAICENNTPSDWVGPFVFMTSSPGLTCNAPIVIGSTPYSTVDSTANYGDSTDESQPASCAAGDNFMLGNDVFYSYTPTETGAISITMTPTSNASGIFVYEGCGNVGDVCLAGVGNNGSGVRDIPSVNVTAGQQYIIVISSNSFAGPQTVDYTLVVQTLNCAPPSNLNATGTGPNSANLSWNGGTATSWEVFVQTAGSPIPSGAGQQTNINTNYPVTTLTGTATQLQLGTPYQYWVRNDCGDGTFSPWAGPYLFNTTSCSSGCNFIFSMTDTFGDGWNGNTMAVIQDGLTIATIGSTFTVGEGPVTVSVPLCDGPFELFWNAGGSFANEIGVTVTNSFGQVLYTMEPGTEVQNTSLFIGTVDCNEPLCMPPTNLSVSSPTMESAQFTWSPGGDETAWQVIAVPAGSPAPANNATGWTAAPSSPFILTGLESGTSYDFYIRAVCDADDLSSWGGPLNFNTTICPPADQCLFTFTMTDTFGDGWNGNTMAVMQNGITVATIGSTFTTGEGPVTVQVPLCHGIAFELFWNNGGAFANEVGVSITSFLGEALYTLIPGTGNQGTTLFSGTGECITPTCIKPTDVTIDGFTLDSVTVSWTENNTPPVGSWDIIVLPASSPAPTPTSTGWTNVTTNPYTVTGLTSATSYKVYVRSVCSATDSSFWSVGTPFNTQICLPSNLCDYTFVMQDSFGDGWNGNTMNVTQNGILITTLTGPTPADDQNPVIQVLSLCNDIPFELFWNNGGFFENEVMITIYNQTGDVVFTHPAGTGAQGTELFSGTVNCIPATCPKPVQLDVDDLTETGATFSWTESGTATAWEIIILPAGSLPPTNATSGIPATNPMTVTNLDSGTSYVFYVRALCSETDISNWSGPVPFATLITNDECSTAIVVPVNGDQSCAQTVSGTVIGATPSNQPNTCGGTPDDDVWFTFTATGTVHTINFSDFGGSTSDLFHVVYQGNSCGTMTQLYCSDFEESIANNLTPGQTYFIQVYTWTDTPNQTSTFNVCIGTIPPPIASNTTQYTNTQLIEDILLNTTCASVTNVTSSTGIDFGLAENGIGYFTQNGSSFPFQDGIVLTTGNANSAPGPNNVTLSDGFGGWPGDPDLLQVLTDQGVGGTLNNATVLEFDFVPLIDSISFNFIFASEEYGVFQCGFSDVFAFLLTNTVTNVTTNLAIVPNTTTPISVFTIRDAAYNNGCPSVNPEYFDTFFQLPEGQSPLSAPINFNGMTVPLTASATVVPGTQYHIKLAIADFNDTAFDSAVFLEGGSFGIGNIELGENLLESTGNAVCSGGSATITTALDPALYTFQWLNGDGIIQGETQSSITVTEEGTYTLQATHIGTTCFGEDQVIVEFYDPIVPGVAADLYLCSALDSGEFNLTQNQSPILAPFTGGYSVSYFTSQADAVNNVGAIAIPTAYTNISNPQTIFVRVVNDFSGCFSITAFDLILQDLTPQFTLPQDFSICSGADETVSVTPVNFNLGNATFSWTINDGPVAGTSSSIPVTVSGSYEVTINHMGCTSTSAVNVTVVEGPEIVSPGDQTECSCYVLPALTSVGNYFSAPGGQGPLAVGTCISQTQVVYIYASDNVCSDEESFTVNINGVVADNPGNVFGCDQFQLPGLSPGNAYYSLPGGQGPEIPAGTFINTDQTTIYIYASNGSCTDESSFIVTLGTIEADDFADVIRCDSYTLPTLSANNTFYASSGGPNGGGSVIDPLVPVTTP
ncbi:MAG TPA: choice-of-anchor L domain-containing protein, partial [Flavobacterium sp.]